MLAAAVLGALAAAPVGLLCVRYVKIYFGMLTLAFGMVFYTFLLKFYRLTGGDEGMRCSGRSCSGSTWTRCHKTTYLVGPYYYYCLGVLVVAAARHVADRALALRPLPAHDPRQPARRRRRSG